MHQQKSKIQAVLFFVAALLSLSRCAQVVSPTGGKKDTIAPVLLNSFPQNKAINYKGNTITLEFNEYVVLDNILQKLIITPEVENPYIPKTNKNKVELKFKKPFPENTTYTFNFGQSIKDFAEKNPANNLKLVFSTGPKIDSGRVYGKISDLLTGQPVFNALVGLYKPSDTLNPEKQKPYYFSRTDSSGYFAIENTVEDHFSLIAQSDDNNNLLFNPKTEKIAFLDSTIRANADSSLYEVRLFPSNSTELKIQRTIPKVNTYSVQFSKGLDTYRVSFPDNDSIPYLLEKGNELKFYNVRNSTDTLLVRMNAVDSLGQEFEADQKIAFQVQRSRQRQLDPLSYHTSVPKGADLPKKFEYKITFSKPVHHIDYSSIQLYGDTLNKTNLSQYKPAWNHTRNELTFQGTNPARDSLKILLPKGAVITVDNDTLPETLLFHTLLKEENYGIVDVKVGGNTAGIPVFVELLDKEFKVVQTRYAPPFIFRQIPQGEYYFRLVEDKNQNGRWDPGNYAKKLQPEVIHVAPVKLNVKANFEYSDTFFNLP